MSQNLSSMPKYRTLSDELKAKIEAGHYRSGEQIPTELELVNRYQVSRNTVRQAIAILEEDNYLIRRRGAGTFVSTINAKGKPVRTLKSIVVLIVKNSRVSDYSRQLVSTAEQWALERNIRFATATLDTEDLLKGRRPAIVDPEHCQAIFFDGWVDDMHCLIAEDLNIPYLVVGNRLVSSRRPQIRLDVPAIVQRMVDHLLSITSRQQPIALMLEPLELHLTKEIVTAYTQQMHRLPQQLPMLEFVSITQARQGMERLLDKYPQPFSLITIGTYLPPIFEVYEERSIDPTRHPVLALTHTFEMEMVRELPFHLMPFGGDTVMATALSEFLAAYEQGHTPKLHISLCPKKIISPQVARP